MNLSGIHHELTGIQTVQAVVSEFRICLKAPDCLWKSLSLLMFTVRATNTNFYLLLRDNINTNVNWKFYKLCMLHTKHFPKLFYFPHHVLGPMYICLHYVDLYTDKSFRINNKLNKYSFPGHMHRITNSMLVVNVTSPVTELSHMSARFGFVEPERRLVAMVVTPTSTTG